MIPVLNMKGKWVVAVNSCCMSRPQRYSWRCESGSAMYKGVQTRLCCNQLTWHQPSCFCSGRACYLCDSHIHMCIPLQGLAGAMAYTCRVHIPVSAGPRTWEVEDSSWAALAGSLPHLKHLSVAALMTGRIPLLPGERHGWLAVCSIIQ
jgi:hypothetical protein